MLGAFCTMAGFGWMLTRDRVASDVVIIGLAANDAVFDTVTPFGFCSVFTSNTFIGTPLLVVVITVPVLPCGLAQMNCCGLKLNCGVLDVTTFACGFIKIFVGTNETVEMEKELLEKLHKRN